MTAYDEGLWRATLERGEALNELRGGVEWRVMEDQDRDRN